MNSKKNRLEPHFPSKKSAWRCRVKLMIGRDGIGLYKPGTHEIIDTCECSDHHPLINEILKAAKSLGLEPYDEKTRQGIFRAIQITVNPKTTQAQVAFSVVKPKEIPAFHDAISSLWINVNPKKTNAIFSQDWRHLFGDRLLPITILEKTFFFHPGAFIQANLEVFEKAIEHMREHMPKGKTLTEYYSGIGVMGTLLSKKYDEVHCVEINPFAEECFEKSTPPPHVHFTHGTTEENIIPSDVSLLDPPRKGVDVKPLYTINSPHIVYMSCNPKTFERDASALKERGYVLTKRVTFDFFPGTDHLEVLGYFRRSED